MLLVHDAFSSQGLLCILRRWRNSATLAIARSFPGRIGALPNWGFRFSFVLSRDNLPCRTRKPVRETPVVEVTIQGGAATFELKGWSRVWALRSQVKVPLSSLRAVTRAPADIGRGWWKGLRMPGTHVPGVIVAGCFYIDREWEFWDVRGAGDSAIEVVLSGASFSRLVVDVANPGEVVSRLQSAMKRPNQLMA
jgi:hypothetical protein